ncbi:MAG: response regulator transcription factor [Rhodoferax sp.]|jgi:two-component system nitrate/nitrite response regulator NarL|uniref:response regulator transcription factor n=1 Tax=Rhodoferax sp. TaxID=50421 RepID=UPI001B5FD534|nr:response regulator transcription factor [Rhodoferax sp.]MBP9147429.1 response regulator transcription factor [Rhodoferax sp.]MBP9735075.1 response regulator transcription factor [Rhodoferax sp.]
MNTEQFFLGDSETQIPSRWRQSFPAGRFGGLSDLQSLNLDGWDGLLWISCADSEWETKLKEVRLKIPSAKVVVLSDAPQEQQGLLALDGGARGYTHSHAIVEVFQEVALVVQHGGLWVGPELLQRLVGATFSAISKRLPQQRSMSVSDVWAGLSSREAQVARLVVDGRSNKEVADRLFISERTVKAHLGVVFDKLGVRDRLQLALRLVASQSPDASLGELRAREAT